MADSDFLEVFKDLTLSMSPQTLQFEEGNVIIKLSDRLEDTLVLHESVLGSTSEHFHARFSSKHWSPTREAVNSGNGETVRIFEYHLIYTENTHLLTDEKEKAAKDPGPASSGSFARSGVDPRHNSWHTATWDDVLPELVEPSFSFQYSSFVEGYKDHTFFRRTLTIPQLRAWSILQHKILFATVYDQPLDFDFLSDLEALHCLVEVTALAEYLQLLPLVAARIDMYIQTIPRLWADIYANPSTYIIIGEKLRSYEIYADGMRHYVGRQLFRYSMVLTQNLDLDFADEPEIRARVSHYGWDLQRAMHGLVVSLHELALTRYQPHANAPTVSTRGVPVKTTWAAATLGNKSMAEKCRWVAQSIYREKLDQLLSLYYACKALTMANKSPHMLDLFGKAAANRFAAIFDLYGGNGEHPAALIAKDLRYLVRTAVQCIEQTLAHPDIGPCLCHGGYDNCAKYSKDVPYFTYNYISPYLDVPWADVDDPKYRPTIDDKPSPWDDFVSDAGVEPASLEWLDLVGVE